MDDDDDDDGKDGGSPNACMDCFSSVVFKHTKAVLCVSICLPILLGGLIIPVCDCVPEIAIDYTTYHVDGDISTEQWFALNGMRENSQYKVNVDPVFGRRLEELKGEEGAFHDRELQQTYRTRKSTTSAVYLDLIFLQRDKENLLDCAHLTEVKKMEQLIFNESHHQDWCWLNTDGESCLPYDSAINYMFPSAPSLQNASFVEDDVLVKWDGKGACGNIQEIAAHLYQWEKVGFFDRDFGSGRLKGEPYKSSLLKSQMKFGLPLAGYSSINDRRQRQMTTIREQIKGMIDLLDTVGSPDIVVVYSGPGVYDEVFLRYLNEDVFLIFGSLVFITVYMIFHTKSLLFGFAGYLPIPLVMTPISRNLETYFSKSPPPAALCFCPGILSIFLSLPVTLFLYIALLGNEKVGVLNTAFLFVILGIGCDDVFVFYDTWRQVRTASNKAKRVQAVFRKCGPALGFTSVTTAVAFLSNCASNIAPVRDFGVFMGSLVMVNYFLVMTFFASVVILRSPDGMGEKVINANSNSAGSGASTTAQKSGPTHVGKRGRPRHRRMTAFFDFVHTNMYSLTVFTLVFIAVCASYIPELELEDQTVETLPSDAKIELYKEAEKYHVAACNDCTYDFGRYAREETFTRLQAKQLVLAKEEYVEVPDLKTGRVEDHPTGYIVCFVFGCLYSFVAFALCLVGYATYIGKTVTLFWIYNVNPLSLRADTRRNVAYRVWIAAFFSAAAGFAMVGVSVNSVKSDDPQDVENEIRSWVQLGFGIFFLVLSLWTGFVGKATYDQQPLDIWIGSISPLQLTASKQKSTGFRLALLSVSSAVLGIVLVSTSRASKTDVAAWSVDKEISAKTKQEFELVFGVILFLISFTLFVIAGVSFHAKPVTFLKIYQIKPCSSSKPGLWFMSLCSLGFFIGCIVLLVKSDHHGGVVLPNEEVMFHNTTLFFVGLVSLIVSIVLALSAIANMRQKPWKLGPLVDILPLSESRASKTFYTVLLWTASVSFLVAGTVMAVYGMGAEVSTVIDTNVDAPDKPTTTPKPAPARDLTEGSQLAFGIIGIVIASVFVLWAFYSGGSKLVVSVDMQMKTSFWKKHRLAIRSAVSVVFLIGGILLIFAANNNLESKPLLDQGSEAALNQNLGAQYYPLIYLAWGSIANPHASGGYNLDPNFDLADPTIQAALAETCDGLEYSAIIAENIQFRCIPSMFRDWVRTNYDPIDDNITWPVPKDEFNEIFFRWSYSNKDNGGGPYADFFQLDEDGNVLWFITYMYGRFDSELPYTSLSPHYKVWENTIETSNMASPMGGNRGFQACEEWVRMRVEEQFVIGMYWNVGLTFAVSVLSTAVFLRNVNLCCTIGVLMICLIMCIISSLAMMKVKISVVEALALSVILDLSVDYAMHIAHAYLLSKAPTRTERTKDALLERGGSVLSGAAATMGACFIPYFGKLQIFPSFSRIFMITILYSVCFVLVVLPLMLLFTGPPGHGKAGHHAANGYGERVTVPPGSGIEMTARRDDAPVKEDDIELKLGARDQDMVYMSGLM